MRWFSGIKKITTFGRTDGLFSEMSKSAASSFCICLMIVKTDESHYFERRLSHLINLTLPLHLLVSVPGIISSKYKIGFSHFKFKVCHFNLVGTTHYPLGSAKVWQSEWSYMYHFGGGIHSLCRNCDICFYSGLVGFFFPNNRVCSVHA